MSQNARFVIVQTHVQEYRVKVFSDLFIRTRGSLAVWAGWSEQSSASRTHFPWMQHLKSYNLLGLDLFWQIGHFSQVIAAEVAILEANPRILSTWLILLIRKICVGKKTVLWGHLYPRAGRTARTRFVRFLMFNLSDEVNLYTHTDAITLRSTYGGLKSNVSPNAVMWRSECKVTGLGKKKHRLLFIARMVAEKKPILLLDAFALALQSLREEIHLDFIGDGPLKGELLNRVNALGLQDHVSIHGAIYDTKILRSYYEEALWSLSPGYVGLSATQSFGFGVPMLIARSEQHSVEIELCREGFNCAYFSSDSTEALANCIIENVRRPPFWSQDRDAICANLRESYTLDKMSEGFMRLLLPHMAGFPAPGEPFHIVIAWIGLPYYAARVISEAMRSHPNWKITVISSHVGVSYEGVDQLVGGKVHWIDSSVQITWREIGVPMPDLMLISSWPHKAYNYLAEQAKQERDTKIVCMVDNILRGTPKQIFGAFYFRLVLGEIYSAMWVPGRAGQKYMRFLGVPNENIYTGLYAADSDIFVAPHDHAKRRGILFVGQFIPRKGLRPLAAIAGRWRAQGHALDLKLIGSGPLRQGLLQAGLDVMGFKQPQELVEYYQSASALILPSTLDHWGVVVHEAALCGCLLLLTDQCGSSADLVEHKRNGYIMRNSSESEIEAALDWFHNLTENEVREGRELSVARGLTITPYYWADTLDHMVARLSREAIFTKQLVTVD